MSNTLFRYSGNKNRLIKFYKKPDESVSRIIEPFAGSMSYSMSYDNFSRVGIELNKKIYDLWKWLMTLTENELNEFDLWFKSHTENFDIRNEDIKEEWKSLCRLNSGSMMTGHITKNIIYPIAKPFDKDSLLSKLYKVKFNFEIYNDNCLTNNFEYKSTDLVFIDPPYINSGEDYGYSLNNIELVKFIKKLEDIGCKIIFTHGDDAQKLYPEYNWQVVKKIINSKSRSNSTQRERTEFVSYLNFN